MSVLPILPVLGDNSTTKGRIISLLSQEWPLSTRQIYLKIVPESKKQVSYQAVHKLLKQLAEQGILSKQQSVYQLKKEWIQQVKDFSQTIDYVYSNESGKLNLPKDFSTPVKIEFKDVNAQSITLANLVAHRAFSNGEEKPGYLLMQHGLWPLRFNFLDFEILVRMAKSAPLYAAFIGDTPFDRWLCQQYLTSGFKKAKTRVPPTPYDGNFGVQGDIVVQVEYSPETLEFIRTTYNKMSNLSDLFRFYIQNTISKFSFHSTMTIQKNPVLAKILRENILQLVD